MKTGCIVLILTLLFANTANAEDETNDRQHQLESNWNRVKLGVGELVSTSPAFHQTLCTFTRKRCFKNEDDFLFVSGDLEEFVFNTKVVHIKGDLKADINIGDHSELVIGGDVKEDITISSDGISRIFIGGSLYGKIESSSSTKVYVMGDFNGSLLTGSPSTYLLVKRNFNGLITPMFEKGSWLLVDVKGFTEQAVIESIYEPDRTKINGFFASSNMPKGFYRLKSHYLTVARSISGHH